jgi:hypothetical protein
LKKLSIQDRNLLLSGDPLFQFDPVVYSCVFFLPKPMLPDVLNNHFDYLIPDEIIPLIVDERDNENDTSDSDSSDSYHGFDSTSDVPSDSNVINTSHDSLNDNDTNEPNSNVHAPDANTLNRNLNDEKDFNVHTPTNPSASVHAPGAGTKTKTVKFNVPKIKNVLPDPSLSLPCTPPSAPWLSPSGTRSGMPYLNPKISGNVPTSSPCASPTLLGRTGKMLGKLMDSHPLAEPKRKK